MTVPTAATPRAGKAEHRHHTLNDLYHERTHFNFIDRSWRWALLSGIADPDLGGRVRRSAASTSASTSRAARSGSSR